MTKSMTLADFGNLTRTKMVDFLKGINPELVRGKTRAKTEDLVNVYKTHLLEKLGEMSREAGAIIERETTVKEGEVFNLTKDSVTSHAAVMMTIAGEQHSFSTHEEALAFLESQREALGPDYAKLEVELLNRMGVSISVSQDRKLAFVVQGKEGDTPQMFDDPHKAIQALLASGAVRIPDSGRNSGRLMTVGDGLEGHLDALHRLAAEVQPPVLLEPKTTLRGLKPKAIIADEIQDFLHVHGPDCGHDHELPMLAGMEEFERANPELPTMPFQDGAVIQLPPSPQDTDFILKSTGQPGELNEKQRIIVLRFKKAYETFCTNVEDSGARREAKSAIYDLKNAGVILHPRFTEELEKGAKMVRDARRIHKMGVDVSKTVKSTSEDQKLNEAVREANAS